MLIIFWADHKMINVKTGHIPNHTKWKLLTWVWKEGPNIKKQINILLIKTESKRKLKIHEQYLGNNWYKNNMHKMGCCKIGTYNCR